MLIIKKFRLRAVIGNEMFNWLYSDEYMISGNRMIGSKFSKCMVESMMKYQTPMQP